MDQIELLTSPLYVVETAESTPAQPSRATLTIKLINKGANSKHLMWTPETMEKIAHQFRGVPFRYDLNGQNEGSHTREHLSSPFYDVGWTYSGENGAWYDAQEQCVYVKGEVTHPEVVSKLARQTSDGKREINFASMGAMISPNDTACSICGKAPFGACKHERGKSYSGVECCMVPSDITKALHVALTNDPADRVAEIADAVFQDMSNNSDSHDPKAIQSPVPVGPNLPGPKETNDTALLETIRKVVEQILAEKNNKVLTQDSSEEIKMEEEKKKKKLKVDDDVEEKVEDKKEKKAQSGNDEVAKGDKDLKKETSDETETKEETEEEKKKKKKEKVEVADAKKPKEDEEEEFNDESEEDEKEKKKKKKQESSETKKVEEEEHKKDDKKEDKKEMADDIEFRIVGPTVHTQKTPQVITQDNAPVKQAPIVETADNSKYAAKYKTKLLTELSDSYVKFNKVKTKEEAILVLQDKSIEQLEIYQEALDGIMLPAKPVAVFQESNNSHVASKFANEVPEYGGIVQDMDPVLEAQDMSPSERREKLGTYGAFDTCFNPQNISKYRK